MYRRPTNPLFLRMQGNPMIPKQDKQPVPNRNQALLAEKRADALRANLKKRKEQTMARTTKNKEEKTDE